MSHVSERRSMRVIKYMTSTIAILADAIVFLLTAIAIQLVLPQVEAEALAERIAPQLSIDENHMRELLANELSKGVGRKIFVVASPFFLLSGLLLFRLITEQHKVT